MKTPVKISTIVFDKTGTLTKGSHEVVRIVALSNKYSKDELLQYTASIESASEHHISKGLMKATESRNIDILPSNDFLYEAGVGVSGRIGDRSIHVGGYLLLAKLNIKPPQDLVEESETKNIYGH